MEQDGVQLRDRKAAQPGLERRNSFNPFLMKSGSFGREDSVNVPVVPFNPFQSPEPTTSPEPEGKSPGRDKDAFVNPFDVSGLATTISIEEEAEEEDVVARGKAQKEDDLQSWEILSREGTSGSTPPSSAQDEQAAEEARDVTKMQEQLDKMHGRLCELLARVSEQEELLDDQAQLLDKTNASLVEEGVKRATLESELKAAKDRILELETAAANPAQPQSHEGKMVPETALMEMEMKANTAHLEAHKAKKAAKKLMEDQKKTQTELEELQKAYASLKESSSSVVVAAPAVEPGLSAQEKEEIEKGWLLVVEKITLERDNAAAEVKRLQSEMTGVETKRSEQDAMQDDAIAALEAEIEALQKDLGETARLEANILALEKENADLKKRLSEALAVSAEAKSAPPPATPSKTPTKSKAAEPEPESVKKGSSKESIEGEPKSRRDSSPSLARKAIGALKSVFDSKKKDDHAAETPSKSAPKPAAAAEAPQTPGFERPALKPVVRDEKKDKTETEEPPVLMRERVSLRPVSVVGAPPSSSSSSSAAAEERPMQLERISRPMSMFGPPSSVASPAAKALGTPEKTEEEDSLSPLSSENKRTPVSDRGRSLSMPTKKKPVVASSSASSSGGSWQPPDLDKCKVCEKTVYAMEKLEADGKVFHKNCFRCEECHKVIGLGSYAALEGKIFCKPHFKQLFKLKGNYNEGFGSVQHKHKWDRKLDDAGTSDC